MIGSHGWGTGPTIEAEIQSSSRQILGRFYSPVHGSVVKRVTLSSSTVDAGNTPTTQLRAGLPLAVLDSGGLGINWDPDAANTGAEQCQGLLLHDIDMLSYVGSAENKPEVLMLTHGIVLEDLIDDFTIGSMILLKEQLGGRIIFDDDLAHKQAGLHPTARMRQYRITGTSTTIADTINNAVYMCAQSGALTVTLPAIIDGGGQFLKFINTVDQNLVVNSAEGDNIIGLHNATADGVSFATTSEKIGAILELTSVNNNGTPAWVPSIPCGNTVTFPDS